MWFDTVDLIDDNNVVVEGEPAYTITPGLNGKFAEKKLWSGQ
jgi:hypothetical protein